MLDLRANNFLDFGRGKMIKVIHRWFERTFADPEAIILSLVIIFIGVGLYFMGAMLMPLLVSIVFAYLLQGSVTWLDNKNVPHWLSVTMVFLLFVGLLMFAFFVFVPLLWAQLTNLFHELPTALNKGQVLLMQLPEHYPEYFSSEHIQSLIAEAKNVLADKGQVILSLSMASVSGVIDIVIYLLLVPLLVFFLLLDRKKIVGWLSTYLPKERGLVNKVWAEVNDQIGNYIRGKGLEIVIVAVVMYIFFALFGNS